MKLRIYVGAVAALAVIAGVFLPTQHGVVPSASVPELALIAALVALAEACQLRYRHRTTNNAFNLMEGMLAGLVFAGGGRASLVACALAILVADQTRHNQPIKVAFNIAQWTLAVAVADHVFRGLRDPSLHSTRSMLALVVAVLAMSLVNQLALGTVLFLATGRALGVSGDRHAVATALAGHGITIAVNLVAAVCLCAAYLWHPATVAVGAVFVIGAYAAGSANASLRADRVRLEGMQRATHALATAHDLTAGLPGFLAEARTGFEVQRVELVLFADGDSTTYGVDHDGEFSVRTSDHPLSTALRDELYRSARFVDDDGGAVGEALRHAGHTGVLASPLRSNGATIGILFLYDRIGMEGFEDGELKIADAIAREAVGFLERVWLLAAVEGERRKLADILGNTSDGIFSVSADGTITSWNAGLASMTGYPAEEMIGTRHVGLLRARDSHGRDVLLERWHDLVDVVAAMPSDLQVVTSAGETVWLSCSYSRIPGGDNGRDVLVVVARNVTQARELERLKDDFVAVVSHELRTPLVPIKGWAQTLLNRGERLSEDQRRTAVQSILAQAQRMESLVLNILEASRIEAGRGDGDGVADVGAIAARIVEELLASRPDRSVRLRPPSVPCQVNGSPVWVERAVANLVANAVKYSPDDEPVDVVISSDGSAVVVSVTDRGPGIAEDAQERIFERFERLEETRTQTGTGLGLYITRRLARAMGGDVTVSSVPGAGSTFLLRLPVAPVSAAASPPVPTLPGPARLPEQRGDVREGDGTVVRLY